MPRKTEDEINGQDHKPKANGIMKEIGVRIRDKRRALGLTHEQVATKADLTRVYICRVENGNAPKVSLETIIRISKAVQSSVSSLIGESIANEHEARFDEILRILRVLEKRKFTVNISHKKPS